MRKPDVFLDRDGVIVRCRRDYVKSPDELEPLPGALEAIHRLCQARHRVIVFTNQSAVGRGILAADELFAIHRRLDRLVASRGGQISGYLVCPHHPDDDCPCRKPRPGLLQEARARMGVDLGSAFVIGDQVSDLEAAWSVGSRAVLTLSGETHAAPRGTPDYLLAADLAGAADLVVANP
jgi:D-glycero-D-manno-heptose 1,7-bisphosphate phosphatase